MTWEPIYEFPDWWDIGLPILAVIVSLLGNIYFWDHLIRPRRIRKWRNQFDDESALKTGSGVAVGTIMSLLLAYRLATHLRADEQVIEGYVTSCNYGFRGSSIEFRVDGHKMTYIPDWFDKLKECGPLTVGQFVRVGYFSTDDKDEVLSLEIAHMRSAGAK